MGSTMTLGIRAAFETPVDDEEIGIPLEEPGEARPQREREDEEILTPA